MPKTMQSHKRKRDDDYTHDHRRPEAPCIVSDDGDELLSEAQKKLKVSTTINMSIIHGPADSMVEYIESQPVFPYRPLNAGFLEIRVIILKAGSGSAPIHCLINHVRADRLSNDGGEAYNALSYTWGSPDVTRTMYLDGITVQVRENLWQALYHLRSPAQPRRLWIDALCINQINIQERSRQVSLMGKIYALAKEVVVWLGPEKHGSKVAIRFIKQSTGSEMLPRVSGIALSSQKAQLDTTMDLLRRDYWERAWIIQEVFQARKISVHCGQDVLCWSDLAKFFRRIQHEAVKLNKSDLYDEELSAIHECTAFKLTKDRTAKNRDLHALILRYKNSLCSDPRDKVFSLCGMSQKHAHLVDYSKSAEDLWQSIVRSEPKTNHKAMYRIWTSQLAQQILEVPAPWSVWKPKRLYNVWRGRRDRFQCLCSHLNIVSRVSPLFVGGLQNLPLVQAWYAQFRGPNMPSFDRVMEAVEGLTDNDLERLGSFKHVRYAQWLNRTKEYPGQAEYPKIPWPMWESAEPPSSYHDLRLFTTHNGRLGFSICSMEEGDEVRRFSGSDVALIFDRQESEWTNARVLIINSDRSRNGYVPIRDPSHRYAIPDGEDIIAKCERVKDADLGEGTTVDAVRSSSVIQYTFNIDQLQFWTW